jgi:DNA-binding transcriptional ArsR family regulator
MYPILLTVLADPARMRIAETLRLGERAVAEIVASVGIRQSGVSRHLGILQDAGIVSVRPDGQRRIYSLRPEPFQEIESWAASYRGLWEDRLDRFGAALDRRTSARKTSREGEK